MQTSVITLDYPLPLADGTRTELEMRRPTLGDVMDHPIKDDYDMKGESSLLAALCGLKPEEARVMDLSDYRKLQAQLVRFRDVAEGK